MAKHGWFGGLYSGLILRITHINLQLGIGAAVETAAPRLVAATTGLKGRKVNFFTLTTGSALLSAALSYPVLSALQTLRRNEVDVDEQENGIHYMSSFHVVSTMVAKGGEADISGFFDGLGMFLVRRGLVFILCNTIFSKAQQAFMSSRQADQGS